MLLDDVLSGLDVEMTQTISSRLFGPTGLLRKLATTVVFATHTSMSQHHYPRKISLANL
jgi:ABC-type uncharacterized transport system ATPase subunit